MRSSWFSCCIQLLSWATSFLCNWESHFIFVLSSLPRKERQYRHPTQGSWEQLHWHLRYQYTYFKYLFQMLLTSQYFAYMFLQGRIRRLWLKQPVLVLWGTPKPINLALALCIVFSIFSLHHLVTGGNSENNGSTEKTSEFRHSLKPKFRLTHSPRISQTPDRWTLRVIQRSYNMRNMIKLHS